MNPRERVLKAFRKMDGYPDRVPIQFELCKQLLEHFGEKLGIPVSYTNNLYEDVTYRISGNEIRIAMGRDDLIFWGAIDQQELLPKGSDEELEADIEEKIRILGKDRGYMISPAHIIQADVSPERVEKFIELCLKHGKY